MCECNHNEQTSITHDLTVFSISSNLLFNFFSRCIDFMPLPFLHHSTILIAGPGGCGNTYFLINDLCHGNLSD